MKPILTQVWASRGVVILRLRDAARRGGALCERF
jgi:hypothetical protein